MPTAPHFALDPRTLHLILLVFGIAAGGALWLIWRRHPAIPGVPDWAWGVSLIALGGMGIGLRGAIPDLLSIVLANAALIGGHAFLLRGIRRFRGLPMQPGQVLPPTLLTLLFQLAAITLAPHWLVGRIVFISAMIGILDGLAAHALVRSAPMAASIVNRILAALTLLGVLNYGMRISLTLLGPTPLEYLGSDTVQGVFLLAALFLGLAKIFGFLTLISDWLQAELNRAATHDFLTQLPNRRAFYDQAQLEISRIARGAPPAAVLWLDLDHFKALNDTYGHAAGDAALQAFGRRLGTCLRQHDQGSRYGGEEFCVLLPETTMAEALTVAERIRAATAAAAGPGIGTTVSIGMAPLAAGQSLEEAVSQADKALYAAKRAGRNRIEAAPEAETACPSLFLVSQSAP